MFAQAYQRFLWVKSPPQITFHIIMLVASRAVRVSFSMIMGVVPLAQLQAQGSAKHVSPVATPLLGYA